MKFFFPHQLLVFSILVVFFSDPCSKNQCEHICVLTHIRENNGLGYKCLCSIGYELSENAMNCTSKAKIHEHLNIHRCHKSTGITNDNFTCVQWLHYLYSICGFFERGGGGGGGLVCILKSHHLVNLIMLLL